MAQQLGGPDLDSAIDSWLACEDALPDSVAGGFSGNASPSESPSLSSSSSFLSGQGVPLTTDDGEQEVDTQTMHQLQPSPPRHEGDREEQPASVLWAHQQQQQQPQPAHGHHGGPWGGILSHLESITSTLEPLFPASSPPPRHALSKHADYFIPPSHHEPVSTQHGDGNDDQGEEHITTPLLPPAPSSDSVGHHQHTNRNSNGHHHRHPHHLSPCPRPSHKTHSPHCHFQDDGINSTASTTATATGNDSTNSRCSNRWYDEREVARRGFCRFGSYGESTRTMASAPDCDFASFRKLVAAPPSPSRDWEEASAPIGVSSGISGVATEGAAEPRHNEHGVISAPALGDHKAAVTPDLSAAPADPRKSGSSPSYDGDFVRGTTDWLVLSETLRKNGLPALTFVTRPTQSLGIPNPAHERTLFRAFEEALVQLNRRALLLDQLIEANKRAEARMGRYKDEAVHLRSQRDKLQHCWLETESAMETMQQQFQHKHNEQLEDFFKLRKEHDHALQTIKEQERALLAKDLEIAALRRQMGRARPASG